MSQQETQPSRLAAVIVNHDSWPDVERQLHAHGVDSPERFDKIDWVVVHNGSDPAGSLGAPLSKVRIEVCENHGYGAAINFAAQRTIAPFLLVMNADLIPEPGFLNGVTVLIDRLTAEPRVGVVGLGLLDADGKPQGSVGSFPTLARFVAGAIRPRKSRKYSRMQSSIRSQVAWVTGACFVIRRDCLDELGGFDERFFMYYEDVDFCRRCTSAGWMVVHEPNVRVRHLHPYHQRPLTHRMVALARHGLLFYFFKHRPAWESWVLSRIALAECRLRLLSADRGNRHAWRKVQSIIRRTIQTPLGTRLNEPDLP